MESTEFASKEPVIGEIMTNIESDSGSCSCFSSFDFYPVVPRRRRPRRVTSGTIEVSVLLRRALQVSMQKPISVTQRARHSFTCFCKICETIIDSEPRDKPNQVRRKRLMGGNLKKKVETTNCTQSEIHKF